MAVIKVSRGQYTGYETILKSGSNYLVDANVDFDGFDIIDIDDIDFITAGQQINSVSGSFDILMPSGGDLDIIINSVTEYTFASTTLDLLGNFLSGVGLIQGSTTTNQIDDTTGGWQIKVGSGDEIQLIANSVVYVDASDITDDLTLFAPNDIILKVTGAGDLITFDDGSGPRIQYEFSNDDFSPVDNVSSNGKSGRRWTEVWAVNGTIQTSFTSFKKNTKDADIKKCLDVCEKLTPMVFEWKDTEIGQMKPEKLANYVGRKYFGFNADALKTECPESVAGEDGIYTGAVIAHLLGAVQYLNQRVKVLESPN